MSKQFYFKQLCLALVRSKHFSSNWPVEKTLLSATTTGKSEPGSDGNERLLRIPQSSSINTTSPSDCLVSYQDTRCWRGVIPQQRSSWCILRILGFASTIWSYGQISISCTIPSGSPSPPTRVKSFTLFTLVYCTHLLCDLSYRLYHHITHTCYFVTSYPFSL